MRRQTLGKSGRNDGEWMVGRMAYPEPMARLIAELERLPGIGPRTAERLAHHLVRGGADPAQRLARAIDDAVRGVRPCSTCFHLADRDPCPICADASRDHRRILVVEQSRDLEAMERAGWRGVYHVLHGSVRPDGAPTASLTLDGLEKRLAAGEVDEVVLGTDPDFEGDGTALVVASLIASTVEKRRELGAPGIAVSRLARGVPTGSAIEYTNPAVLAEALSERKRLSRGLSEGGVS
jgi:recombination protein RecR